jgi:hypothetical protein
MALQGALYMYDVKIYGFARSSIYIYIYTTLKFMALQGAIYIYIYIRY